MIDNFQIVIYSGSNISLAIMFTTLKKNNKHSTADIIPCILVDIADIFVKGMNKLGNIFMYIVFNVTSWIGCQISEITILLLKIICAILN